jgi:hypothetical protein
MDDDQKKTAASGKTSKVTATLLAAACVGLMASQAKAGSIYSDSTTDTSNDSSHPTMLPAGTTEVDGNLDFGDIGDAFIIPLPHTGSPTSVVIDYTYTVKDAGDGTITFNFSDSNGGNNVSRVVGSAIGSGSLTLSVPANLDFKVYAFTGGEVGTPNTYTIDASFPTPVPLPKSAELGAAGLATLGALALLGKKAKPAG